MAEIRVAGKFALAGEIERQRAGVFARAKGADGEVVQPARVVRRNRVGAFEEAQTVGLSSGAAAEPADALPAVRPVGKLLERGLRRRVVVAHGGDAALELHDEQQRVRHGDGEPRAPTARGARRGMRQRHGDQGERQVEVAALPLPAKAHRERAGSDAGEVGGGGPCEQRRAAAGAPEQDRGGGDRDGDRGRAHRPERGHVLGEEARRGVARQRQVERADAEYRRQRAQRRADVSAAPCHAHAAERERAQHQVQRARRAERRQRRRSSQPQRRHVAGLRRPARAQGEQRDGDHGRFLGEARAEREQRRGRHGARARASRLAG